MDEEHKNRVKSFLNKNKIDDLKKFHKAYGRKMIIHADYRGSNIMYKEINNGRWSVMPVDYQTVRVGCGMTDLLYFIICSTDEELRKEHFNQLLDHYYTELSQDLRWLGIDSKDVYTRQQFDLEVKEKLRMSLLLVVYLIPMVLVSSEAAPVVGEPDANIEDFCSVTPNADAFIRVEGYIRDLVRLGVL